MANGISGDGPPACAGDLAAGALPRTLPPGGMPAIAMFHSVSPYDDDPYLVTVTPDRFDRQMRWLRRRGLRGVAVGELMAADRAGAGRGLIGLTFDDGYADFVDYALPVLARYGFGATVFPIAGWLGGLNDWDVLGPRKPLMSADQVRKAADAGIEIGSHGLRHVSLPGLAEAGLAAEAAESRAILTETIDRDVTGFCYPYGHIDASSVAAVQQARRRLRLRHLALGQHRPARAAPGLRRRGRRLTAAVGQGRPALAGLGLPGPGSGPPGPGHRFRREGPLS